MIRPKKVIWNEEAFVESQEITRLREQRKAAEIHEAARIRRIASKAGLGDIELPG